MTEPRQTRVVSADGQWRVELRQHRKSKRHTEWLVLQVAGKPGGRYFAMPYDHIPDTGQDAREVLAQWEQERA